MKRIRRTLAVSFAALLAAGSLTVITGGVASAAGCQAAGCTDLDPYSEQCPITSSVTKTASYNGAVATVVNYYSSACDANWLVAYENGTAVADGWSLRLNIYSYEEEYKGAKLGKQGACYPGIDGGGGGVDGIYTSTYEDCDGSTYNGSNGWPMWTDMVDGLNTAYGQMYVYGNAYGAFVEADQ